MMIHQQLPNPLLLPHIKGTSQQIFAPLSAALIHPIPWEQFGDYSACQKSIFDTLNYGFLNFKKFKNSFD